VCGGGDNEGHVLRGTTSRGLCCVFITAVVVFITAVPFAKLFAGGREGGGTMEDMCYERDYEPRPVWTSLPMGPVRNPVL
jgi:hypothetical protein